MILSKLCVCFVHILMLLSVLQLRAIFSFKILVKTLIEATDICFVIVCNVALMQFF